MGTYAELEEGYKRGVIAYPLGEKIPKDSTVHFYIYESEEVIYAYVGCSYEKDFVYEIYQRISEEGFPLDVFVDAARDHGENSYSFDAIADRVTAADLFEYD